MTKLATNISLVEHLFMDIWFNIPKELSEVILQAAAEIPYFDKSFNPDIRTTDPRFGDFQANGVLSWGKNVGQNPRQVAQKLMETVEQLGILDPTLVGYEIAGPGFINFQLTTKFLLSWLKRYRKEDDLKTAAGDIYRGKRIVVDFSSPNSSKQMHVGHIRSIVIGEAICRLLTFCGAYVIRDNHIGDWGTQYGILMMAIKRFDYNLKAPHKNPLNDFETLYREGNALVEKDQKVGEKAREELVKLQNGDLDSLSLWKEINKISLQALQEIYDLLDIHFDETLGESYYRDQLNRVYQELIETGIAEESQGALVVFHREHSRYKTQPFIIRKSDGASLYSTTDLATILYRHEHFQADEINYVVDSRQSDHFEQLFLTVRKWFFAKGIPLPKLKHISFGTILGEDRKAIKTRSGEQIKLKDLLNEAVHRAFNIVCKKNPGLTNEEYKDISHVVGIGAVRYADLMQNRTSDYVFSWDKLLSFEGNTAPYLLYAVARIYSIFRRAKLQPGSNENNASEFETETEIALAQKLIQFVTVLEQTVNDLRPHFLCTYLYELSGLFSAFYNADKVLISNQKIRSRRLLLCARTLTVLETGLHLLGLNTLAKM